MEKKEKKPWRPPEAAHLPDPIAFAMQGFERFGLSKERLIPPLQAFDRVMQHSAFTENRWWENARQVTATASSEEQWRRVSIERARCLGEPWPDFDDIPVTSITEDFSQKCQNATIGLLRDQVIASCAIPGETLFGDIFNQLGIKEDNMDRSLADKKFKKVTIECEDGTTYAGKINHVCGSPYRWDKLCVEAMVEDKPIGAYGIEKVLFQNPATIVFWSDGTKTVVNCMDNVETKKKIVDGKEVIIRKPRKCDTYSKEAGLAMAIVKKWAGNNGNYNNIFRKFIPEMAEEEKGCQESQKGTESGEVDMTLRELAKGYDGDVLIKAYENEKSKIPTAIMQSSVTDAIKDEILDREIYSYAMVYQSLFTSNLRANFAAAPEETEETT